MSNDAFSSEHGIFRGTQTGVSAQGHREGLQREDQLKKLGSFTWTKKSSPEGISNCPVKPGWLCPMPTRPFCSLNPHILDP